MQTSVYDVAVIGGGIVGLATAMELSGRSPSLRLIVLEKEPQVGMHQTAHNSGVIHSGIYYRPGSLKAKTCVEGARLMTAFCEAHAIPYAICGKVVVATEPPELPALETLYQRGLMNGVPGLSLIGPERLREIEPNARGIRALHVASAGIVDYRAVAFAFAEVIRQRGGTVQTSARVNRLEKRTEGWILQTTEGDLCSRYLVTCGGLYADRIAAMAGAPSDLQIIPFRGDYYDLVPQRRALVRAMIYPVPNPALPFLGVHLTRALDGRVHAGPNAVLALKREGYRKTDISPTESLALVSSLGFWRMARTHWSTGLRELWRSLNTHAFVRALQRLVPDLKSEDVVPGDSGVRAQAVDRHGALVDDFNIVQGDHAIFVRNVPSPAATASIRIGQLIADMMAEAFPCDRSLPSG